MRLALDHLTIVDSTPVQLAETAANIGCTGVCVFLQAMEMLPLMPHFDLIQDHMARRHFRQRMSDLGLTLDLAYPFTLSGRSEVASFAAALDCAAELNAQCLNILIYDRDPERRRDIFAQFCDLADSFGLRVALEFYPASQVRSLSEALALILPLERPGRVGVNVDMLHLMRSGGTVADLALAPAGSVLFGQFADGPAVRPQAEWEFEASQDRLLAGAGAFDLAGFAQALPADCPASVEIPRNAVLAAGLARADRAQAAAQSVRAAIANSGQKAAL